MPEPIGVGAWIASLLIAGSLGWILGDRRGALGGPDDGRMRVDQIRVDQMRVDHLRADQTSDAPGADEVFTLKIADAVTGEDGRCARVSTSGLIMRTGSDAVYEHQPDAPASDRTDIFAEMPSLVDLRAEVDAIRDESMVWGWPDVGERVTEILHQLDAGTRDSPYQRRDSINSISYSWSTKETGSTVQPSASSTRV